MLSGLVVAYLFFGGAGAGACFVASCLALASPRDSVHSPGSAPYYGRLYVSALSCSCACLFVGLLCLALDLGSFDTLLALFLSPRASFISFGAYVLPACAILGFALALSWIRIGWRGVSSRRLTAVRVAHVVAAVVSVAVMAYTGLLLGSVAAVPLWNSPLVPILFVASSLSCGIALVVLAACGAGVWREFQGVLRRAAAIDMATIALEALALFALVAPPLNATCANQTDIALGLSAARLVSGDCSILFWAGLVAAGLVAPFAFELFGTRLRCKPQYLLAACCCVLAGGIFLRVCLVGAGMHPEISTL